MWTGAQPAEANVISLEINHINFAATVVLELSFCHARSCLVFESAPVCPSSFWSYSILSFLDSLTWRLRVWLNAIDILCIESQDYDSNYTHIEGGEYCGRIHDHFLEKTKTTVIDY